MKIKKFTGDKVFGYLPINLIFNDDLSIVTGINGSGKTTAILLMQAILCPNFKDLLSIPFASIELEYAVGLHVETITVTSIDKHIVINHSGIEEALKIEKMSFEELEYNDIRKEKIDINDIIKKKIGEDRVFEIIKSLPSPVFIGLERKNSDFNLDIDELLLERRNFTSHQYQRKTLARFRRDFKGNLGVSLVETEVVVQEAYRRIKSIENRYSSNLKDAIVLSSFDYIRIHQSDITSSIDERTKLLTRRKEIEEALYKIGYGDNLDMKTKLNDFFNNLQELVQSIEIAKDFINIEWLANKSQIDKLTKVLDIIDDNNSKMKKYYKPINLFLDTINDFFVDSNKKMEIDNFGQLLVRFGSNDPQSIDALSSGERQLVIMFANVIFNKSSNSEHENILIIDEPEISLHIRWQEKFIDSLIGASAKTQFIIATHSPDITGDHKKKCIRINNAQSN